MLKSWITVNKFFYRRNSTVTYVKPLYFDTKGWLVCTARGHGEPWPRRGGARSSDTPPLRASSGWRNEFRTSAQLILCSNLNKNLYAPYDCVFMHWGNWNVENNCNIHLISVKNAKTFLLRHSEMDRFLPYCSAETWCQVPQYGSNNRNLPPSILLYVYGPITP